MGGLEALKRIRAHHPQARVLALSATTTRCTRGAPFARERSASFPSAAPRKRSSTQWPRWPRSAYIDVSLAQKLALADIEGAAKSPVERLSEREFEFRASRRGASRAGIAEDLKLSSSTVGTSSLQIKQKLGVSNQSELTLLAIRHASSRLNPGIGADHQHRPARQAGAMHH